MRGIMLVFEPLTFVLKWPAFSAQKRAYYFTQLREKFGRELNEILWASYGQSYDSCSYFFHKSKPCYVNVYNFGTFLVKNNNAKSYYFPCKLGLKFADSA